jgi:hypothetical protein
VSQQPPAPKPSADPSQSPSASGIPPKIAAPRLTADDALPPVSAPDAAFLLQLFLIPLIIVMIVVMVWLLFSWLAHMGSDPKELVRDLKVLNEASWQKANTLSDMLRNREYDHLKDDRPLADELAEVLKAQLISDTHDEKRVRLRIFICRALGEFRVDSGLQPLLEAARREDDPADLDVRYAALEAIAVLAHNVGPERLASDPQVLDVLEAVSRESGEGPDEARRRGELRSTAAFTLGVVGGERAVRRVEEMLSDPYANARYNAANGLARHGDPRALPVLLEMLDAENVQVVADEESDSQRERKRMLVLMNGIRAAGQLARENSKADGSASTAANVPALTAADLSALTSALQTLREADLPPAVQLEATKTLKQFEANR